MSLLETTLNLGRTNFTPFPIAKLSINTEDIDKRIPFILSSDGRITKFSNYVGQDYWRRKHISSYLVEVPMDLQLDLRKQMGEYKVLNLDFRNIPSGEVQMIDGDFSNLILKDDNTQFSLLKAFKRPAFTRVNDLYKWELGSIKRASDRFTKSPFFKINFLERLLETNSFLDLPISLNSQTDLVRLFELESIYESNPLLFTRVAYR